jgi:hypothetical protein
MVPDTAGLSSRHGQESGPAKTTTEKHGNHGAVGVESRSELQC